MAKYKLPSEDDAKRLAEMSEQLRKLERKPLGPDGIPVVGDPMDFYVAKPPPGGIPARVGDSLGCARCQIYRETEIGTGSGSSEAECEVPYNLEPVVLPGGVPYEEMVYNIATSDIFDEYVHIIRSKYGVWHALVPGEGGTGTGSTGTGTTGTDETGTDETGTGSTGTDETGTGSEEEINTLTVVTAICCEDGVLKYSTATITGRFTIDSTVDSCGGTGS